MGGDSRRSPGGSGALALMILLLSLFPASAEGSTRALQEPPLRLKYQVERARPEDARLVARFLPLAMVLDPTDVTLGPVLVLEEGPHRNLWLDQRVRYGFRPESWGSRSLLEVEIGISVVLPRLRRAPLTLAMDLDQGKVKEGILPLEVAEVEVPDVVRRLRQGVRLAARQPLFDTLQPTPFGPELSLGYTRASTTDLRITAEGYQPAQRVVLTRVDLEVLLCTNGCGPLPVGARARAAVQALRRPYLAADLTVGITPGDHRVFFGVGLGLGLAGLSVAER